MVDIESKSMNIFLFRRSPHSLGLEPSLHFLVYLAIPSSQRSIGFDKNSTEVDSTVSAAIENVHKGLTPHFRVVTRDTRLTNPYLCDTL